MQHMQSSANFVLHWFLLHMAQQLVIALVDPVGACVGEKGKRINNIVQELNGEKIDVVHWSEDPKEFIREALSPAKVIGSRF